MWECDLFCFADGDFSVDDEEDGVEITSSAKRQKQGEEYALPAADEEDEEFGLGDSQDLEWSG